MTKLFFLKKIYEYKQGKFREKVNHDLYLLYL